MSMARVRNEAGWLTEKTAVRFTPAAFILSGIVILASFFYFYQLGNIGDANLYYTAAVKSMLQSWSNFFFVAAEPGASVTVDKPPLGLWLEAASAFFLGVNGFAVVLPNILAGLASIPLMYAIVKPYFGAGAGLTAALVVAVTPVTVAASRNNTMDGMLTLTLILAAWAFLRAADTNKTRFLWLGVLLVGVGFNIKMLQAFLPLPAFYAVYFLGAKVSIGRKLINLTAATFILLFVSFSWVVAVDMTPPEARPYIGSSANNTVLELIVGHNGLSRLFGMGRDGSGGPVNSPAAPPPGHGQPPPPGSRFAPPDDGPVGPPPGNLFAPPNDGPLGPPPQNGQASPPNAPGGRNEVGSAGVMRFVEAPLSKEMSWMLPFALVAALLLLFRYRPTWPLTQAQRMLVVWGGWLAIGLLFFSFAGLFHAYYLIMLGPPLAALVGMGAAELWRLRASRPGWALGLLAGTAAGTLIFQYYNAAQFIDPIWPLIVVSGLLLAAGLAVYGSGREQRRARIAFALVLAAMLVTPLVWSYLTVTDVDNVNLPGAYAGSDQFAPAGRPRKSQVDELLLAYLQDNTQGVEYLLAVPSSMQGASYVLETGRPVLYMGGFNGSDPVVGAADIAQMVTAGELRYIMVDGRRPGPQLEIVAWVEVNCTAVTGFNPGHMGPPGRDGRLYQCDQ